MDNSIPASRPEDFIKPRLCKVCGAILNKNNAVQKQLLCKTCHSRIRKKIYHSGGLKEKMQKDYENNTDKYIVRVANNRARKVGATGKITLKEWLKLKEYYGNRCAYCGYKGKLHLEHFIPLSKETQGLPPTNTIDNIFPACEFCNRAKGDKPFIIFLAWRTGCLENEE